MQAFGRNQSLFEPGLGCVVSLEPQPVHLWKREYYGPYSPYWGWPYYGPYWGYSGYGPYYGPYGWGFYGDLDDDFDWWDEQ
jgi:hypothetical protein